MNLVFLHTKKANTQTIDKRLCMVVETIHQYLCKATANQTYSPRQNIYIIPCKHMYSYAQPLVSMGGCTHHQVFPDFLNILHFAPFIANVHGLNVTFTSNKLVYVMSIKKEYT